MFLRMKGAGLSAELSVDCPADNSLFWVARCDNCLNTLPPPLPAPHAVCKTLVMHLLFYMCHRAGDAATRINSYVSLNTSFLDVNLNSFPLMTMKIKLSTLLSTLSAHPEVEEHLDIDGCFKFIKLIQLLKPTLSLHQPPGTKEHIPLTSLLLAVLDFFKVCLNLEHESAKLIWEALCPIAWGLRAPSDMQAFGR